MATNFKRVDKLVDMAMEAGLKELGNDVKKRAIILAPILTGALRRSAKVQVVKSKNRSDSVIISFNTPYARLRHWENRKHPATRRYLTNALKSIRDIGKYFKKF